MKAVIEVAKRGTAARQGEVHDYHLCFESTRSLFAELTPARVDLLDTHRKVGPCSVYALAKAAQRNYSNAYTGVGRLEELGLIERTDGDAVFVPYVSVEILLPLAQVAKVLSAPHKLTPDGMAWRRAQHLTRTLAAWPAFRSAANH
jgi:predicted transcriptional regulator